MPFRAHIELLDFFVARRAEVVERIEGVLNAKNKPAGYRRDRPALARHFEDCFFAPGSVSAAQSRLRGRLQEAHWAAGFKPREIPGMHNDLVDPAEMMRRAFYLWEKTRWPGYSGRVHYAQTLFNVYLIRQLAYASMRVWDAGSAEAGERLAQIQGVLDRLWATETADQPALVRDARWLIPLAQSPATDEVAPYFTVAARIAESFSAGDRIAIQDAAVRMAGGHLRSYLHYYVTQKGMALGEQRLVALARKSNALDFSGLLQGLVPLLAAYEAAVESGDGAGRRTLAESICQGISPDPELFVNEIPLLGAYSMSELLFTTPDSSPAYTAIGRHHVDLLRDYEARMPRVARALYDDYRQFRPVEGRYSPYGVIYGFSSNLLEHMALKTLQRDAITRFGLEDVFTDGDAEKLAWVRGWRELPHVDPEVARLYAYPHAFAASIFDRIERALEKRADSGASTAARIGRIFIAPAESSVGETTPVEDLPPRYVASSDESLVAAGKAHVYPEAQLLRDRVEGHFLVTYETAGGWVAISKDLLTEILEAGRDVQIAALPPAPAERLSLLGRDLVAR